MPDGEVFPRPIARQRSFSRPSAPCPIASALGLNADGAISYASGRRPCVRFQRTYAGSVEAPTYKWRAGEGEHELRLVRVAGTHGKPYLFGGGGNRRAMEVRDFHIATTQVTQALWTHVMGANPA